MKKETFFLNLVLLTALPGCVFAANDKKLNETTTQESRTTTHIVGTDEEASAAFAKGLRDESFIWDRINRGARYFDAGRYEQAIPQFEDVMKDAKDAPDIWVIKSFLGECYEAVGQYEKSLEYINWQIAQGPRKQVVDQLVARKQKLEQLLNKGHIDTVPRPNRQKRVTLGE